MEYSGTAKLLCGTVALILMGTGALPAAGQTAGLPELSDTKATPETKALYANLQRIRKEKILFGHQNSTLFGVGWNADADPERSDVKSACGKLPALYGWDAGNLGKFRSPDGRDLLPVRIREAYRRGGINTISWHMRNPVTGKDVYDTTPAVSAILPGGARHDDYRKELDQFASFIRSLTDENGRPIPIIFRPFHEHTGEWFWWGKSNCTAEEYAELWRFTVKYLRDDKNLHNLLYAYSPAKNPEGSEDLYLWGYPGDEYVDVLGYDHYCQDTTEALPGLRLVVRLARERNKLPAFTETGVPKGTELAGPGNYFTDRLLKPLKQDEMAREIAYIMLWQNSSQERFWIPVAGNALMSDFKNFSDDPALAFEGDIPNIYQKPLCQTK